MEPVALLEYDTQPDEEPLVLTIHYRRPEEDEQAYSDMIVEVGRVQMFSRELRFLRPSSKPQPAASGVCIKWKNSLSQGISTEAILILITDSSQPQVDGEADPEASHRTHQQLWTAIESGEGVTEVVGNYTLEVRGQSFRSLFAQMSGKFSQIEDEDQPDAIDVEFEADLSESSPVLEPGFDFDGCYGGAKFKELFGKEAKHFAPTALDAEFEEGDC